MSGCLATGGLQSGLPPVLQSPSASWGSPHGPCKSLATSGAASVCERDVGESGQEKEHLTSVRGDPPSPRVQGFDPDWHIWGPGSGHGVLQQGVRGRGINRKPHDLIVVFDTGVARLQVDQERRGRIDRHGLWVHYSRVLGVSTRGVREQLERKQAVHLCQLADCQGGEGLHCTSYDAVDAEALVDLGKVSAWRLGVLALSPDHPTVSFGHRFQQMLRLLVTCSFACESLVSAPLPYPAASAALSTAT